MANTKRNSTKLIFKIISVILLSLATFNFTEIMNLSNSVNSIKINLKKSYAVIDEKENSIEIVCVGNSNLYSGFSPLDLWNEYGYTSTICASARQTVEESYNLVMQIFKTQKPNLVIIETDMLFDHNPDKKNFCEKSYKYKDFLQRTNPILLQQDIESIISIVYSGDNKQINTHGYRYSSKICKITYANYMKVTQNSEEITPDNKDNMDKLISLCKTYGCQILFIEMPSISSWNYERYRSVATYAEENNIDFLDFNILYDKLMIDSSQCYRDNGNHLNYYGAKSVTTYIGKIIKDKYSIENLKKNCKYNYWNDNYKQFERYKSKFETYYIK
ncbi:MAG: hypothetical protein NC213_05160 [Acetobacter sp.]|nr:hypothetical protein [Bacteroides sp.]MCM1341114.1 hypothetical protein [Acetobacter sp.]MCM1433552.1 hypothetical protein [Clostridiales bacterium]